MLLGMAVASLPPRHETIVVAGSPYYYANGVYYASAPSGYTVVPAPVGATVEQAFGLAPGGTGRSFLSELAGG